MSGFDQRTTTLDLNGPVLSWLTEPSEVSTCGVATFTGIATATFPSQTPTNPATNTGYLSYQWHYKVGAATTTGLLYDGDIPGLGLTSVSGTGSTTLTLYGTSVTKPYTTEGINFFVRPDYVPSAYGTGDPITAGTGRSTGNANNEVFDSTPVSLIVHPTISVTTQPVAITTAAQTISADFNVGATISDNTQNSSLSYQWVFNGTDLADSSTVTGAATSSLSMSSSTVGVHTLTAKISHSTACNSPIYSNVVDFDVVSSRQIIKYELLTGEADATWYGGGEQNLFDNSIRFEARSAVMSRALCIYAPEKDIKAKITLAGAAGASRDGNRGGQGGISTFYLSLKQNVEYIVKLGSSIQPSGGGGGGGGAAFLYRGGTLIMALGGGGGAGTQNRGGDGGGIGIAGERGLGPRGGSGGILYSTGNLPLQGMFAGGGWLPPIDRTSGSPGRVSGCTFGQYWTGQGYGACQSIGYVKWRSSSGSETSQSTNTILRGYKSGLGHRNDGGNTAWGVGGGGAGAAGGGGSTGDRSGGGGGSGYQNGDVEVISSQLGGNSSRDGYIIFELD